MERECCPSSLRNLDAGAWLAYDVRSDDQQNLWLNFDVLTTDATSKIKVYVNGTLENTILLPDTNGYFRLISSPSSVPLSSIFDDITLVFYGDVDFDYFTYHQKS